MEHFGGGEDRPRDIPEGYEMPGIVPVTPDVERDPSRDISPAERQEIIDDMNREDEIEEERQRRIEEIIRKRKGA